MKRRISETNPKNPSPIREESLVTKVRRSKSILRPPNFYQTRDLNGKKVKFTIPETDHPLNASPVAFGFPCEENEVPKSDGPKTSEYAFFKKLKQDAGRTSHPYSQLKKGDRLEKSELKMSNMVRRSFQNLNSKSSCLVEEVTPINLPSPCSDLQKSSVLVGEVSPVIIDSFPSAFGGPTKSSETQYRPEEVFSRKRHRLRQWVADTSSSSIDELCSKGYDLVSALLSRLFPESNDNNCCQQSEDPKLRQGEIDAKYDCLGFPHSDTNFKKHHWTAISNMIVPEQMPYVDDDSLARQSSFSRKCWLSDWGFVDCNSPISHADKIHLQDRIGEVELGIDGGKTAKFCTETNSALGCWFDSLASNHLMKLDKFHVPGVARQPRTLLLGWNSDNVSDEDDSSFASHGTELSLYPSISSSLNDSYWHNSDIISGKSGWLSSFLSTFPVNFTSPLNVSVSFCNLASEKLVLDNQNDLDAALNHFPLALPFTKKYSDLDEDFHYKTIYRGTSIFPSQNHHPFFRKAFGNSPPALEACLNSAGIDYGLEHKCFSIADSFRKHHSSTFHVAEFPLEERRYQLYTNCLDSSTYRETHDQITEDYLYFDDGLQILNEKKSFPLLLDRSSWDGSEEEAVEFFLDRHDRYPEF